jgi:hypothetical protein
MLRWGIPGYRLPEPVLDAEIQRILDLGVELKCSVKIGQDMSLDELQAAYSAVYVAIGAQQGVRLGVEGEEARNVFSGVDFLNRFHHGERLDLGRDVVVIVVGGGERQSMRPASKLPGRQRHDPLPPDARGDACGAGGGGGALREISRIEFWPRRSGSARKASWWYYAPIRMGAGRARMPPGDVVGPHRRLRVRDPGHGSHLGREPGAGLLRIRDPDRGQELDPRGR